MKVWCFQLNSKAENTWVLIYFLASLWMWFECIFESICVCIFLMMLIRVVIVASSCRGLTMSGTFSLLSPVETISISYLRGFVEFCFVFWNMRPAGGQRVPSAGSVTKCLCWSGLSQARAGSQALSPRLVRGRWEPDWADHRLLPLRLCVSRKLEREPGQCNEGCRRWIYIFK